MPEEKARQSRVLFIDQRIAAGGFPNAVEMAEEYEVSDRTIKRDIEYLRDMHNAPIEYDRARNGYYYSEETWRLPAIMISESEFFALTLASDVLSAYRNSPVYDKISRVFDKLAALLPEKVSIPLPWLERRFSVFHIALSQIDNSTWDVVLQALREGRAISFDYTAVPYTTSVTKIADPYHCIGHRGEWYMIGHDHYKSDIRVYALSRMDAPRLGRSRFEIPDDFDPSIHVDRHFGIYLESEQHRIRVCFAPHLAPYIRERVWHETQELVELDNGGVEVSFTTNQLDAVRFWVQSWGPGGVVLEPEELRETIMEDLKAGLEAYSGTAP